MQLFGKPLSWINEPESYLIGERSIEIGAGAKTDLFMDPKGDPVFTNAPLLLVEADEHFQFSAILSAELNSTFDAAALVVYAAEDCWAKLCFELSPQRQATLVTVVTDNASSDDCNHHVVDDQGVHLRISGLGNGAFAFHILGQEGVWSLVRYFSLDHDHFRVGFCSQSPTGQSCISRFNDPVYSDELLNGLRSGA